MLHWSEWPVQALGHFPGRVPEAEAIGTVAGMSSGLIPQWWPQERRQRSCPCPRRQAERASGATSGVCEDSPPPLPRQPLASHQGTESPSALEQAVSCSAQRKLVVCVAGTGHSLCSAVTLGPAQPPLPSTSTCAW